MMLFTIYILRRAEGDWITFLPLDSAKMFKTLLHVSKNDALPRKDGEAKLAWVLG